VISALLAAQASFGVMGVMTLTGAVVVDHQHHAAHNVFPIIEQGDRGGRHAVDPEQRDHREGHDQQAAEQRDA
jgi:hypothetical protein